MKWVGGSARAGATQRRAIQRPTIAATHPWPVSSLDLAGVDVHADSWRSEALCAETDPEAFFPEKGGSTVAAKRICAGCPVRTECLSWALEHGESGVWGGTSEQERARLRRRGSAA